MLYCAEQGIALRGHDEGSTSLNPGNFKSLIIFLSRHCPIVKRRLQESSSTATWLSPSFQNEIIGFLDDQLCSMIKQELQEANYYIVLADETKT